MRTNDRSEKIVPPLPVRSLYDVFAHIAADGARACASVGTDMTTVGRRLCVWLPLRAASVAPLRTPHARAQPLPRSPARLAATPGSPWLRRAEAEHVSTMRSCQDSADDIRPLASTLASALAVNTSDDERYLL